MVTKTHRVGLLAGSLKGAGAEKTILTLAEALTRKNCAVTLFLLNNDSDYVASDTLEVIRIEGKHRKDKEKKLREITSDTRFDLFVTSRADYYPFIRSRFKFISVHISPYSWIKNENKTLIAKQLKLRRIKKKYQGRKLIALSQGIRDELVNHLGCDASDITVINNPFDITSILDSANQSGPQPDNDYIIYVASFIPRKRHKDLLDAFKRMNTELSLVLVGKGPLEKELKQYSHELGLGNQVIFWGWDGNPYRLIKNARLSVLTSESEGLPRTLIESLILGTATVSTDCPSGPNEVMTGPLADFLVPVGDVEGLATAMTAALESYPDLSQLNLDRFDGEQVASRYLDLMETDT
ncbi:glycosyltransferase [Kaarinaea lacus]